MQQFITRMLEWLPGCSPDVPQTWQQAALQATTCFIRLCVFAAGVYAIMRFVS